MVIFMKLFSIVKKNINVLLKSRGTALLIILGPLILMFFVGLAFDNSNTYRINIGVYSPQYSNLTRSFIEKLDSPFRVIKYSSEAECVDKTKDGTVNTCIIFPEGFDIKSNTTNKVTFYIDYSKLNLVWMVRDVVFSKLSERNEEITQDLTNTLLKKISDIEKEVKGKRNVLVELTTYNNRISENANELNTNLNSLNTSFDTSSFGTGLLNSKIASLKEDALSSITESTSTLKSLDSSIDSLSINASEKQDLKDEINTTLYDLSGLKSDINSLYNGDNKDIDLLLANISSRVSEIKSRFNDIAGIVSKSKSTVNEIQQNVVMSLSAIVEIQGSFDKIKEEINSISIRESSKIVNPVTIDIKPLSYHKTHLSFMFPTLLMIIMMFAGLMLGSTVITLDRNSRANFRNLISPTRPYLFTIGAFLTVLLIIFPQVLILFGVSAVFLKAEIMRNIILALFISFVALALFSLIGMLIGYLFKREESTMLVVLTLSALMLFLSNTLLPLEGMPAFIVKIASFNPFVLSNFALKKTLLFSFTLRQVSHQVTLISIYILVLLLLVFIFNKTNLNKPEKERKEQREKVRREGKGEVIKSKGSNGGTKQTKRIFGLVSKSKNKTTEIPTLSR